MPTIDKETAFAELITDYENLWVAIIEKNGVEFVTGHGQMAVEAADEAKEKGYPKAMLFKVPSRKIRSVF